MPPFTVGIRDGFFPVESCLYALEIKSTVALKDARETIGKFRKVHDLSTLAGGMNVPPKLPLISSNCYRPVTALLAFKGVVGKSMLSLIADANRAQAAPVLQILCVIGQGYWRWTEDDWTYHPPSEDRDEVLDFLGGTLNTIYSAQLALYGAQIGHYISSENRSKRLKTK